MNTQIKKFAVKKLTATVKKITNIEKNQMNLDSALDSKVINVSLIQADINSAMVSIQKLISHTLRNLRIVFLPMNLDNFSLENIREKLNNPKANQLSSNLVQGLNFPEFVKGFRLGFSSYNKSFSIGKFSNSIVSQVKDNQDLIFLDIPTQWIQEKTSHLVAKIVIGLYISSLEISNSNLMLVGKDKNTKIKADIQSVLLSIGLILPELDREYARNNNNGYLNIETIETTLHFEQVFNPLISQLDKVIKESDLRNKQIFREIKSEPIDIEQSPTKRFISVEKNNFDTSKQKVNETHRRLKADYKNWFYGQLENPISVSNYYKDIDNKIINIVVNKIEGLPSVKKDETAYLVEVLRGVKFTTVAKYQEDKAKAVKTNKKDSLTDNESKVKKSVQTKNKN